MIDIVVENTHAKNHFNDLKRFCLTKFFLKFDMLYIALYVNHLFTEFQRNSPKKTSKNLTFMLTRSQNLSNWLVGWWVFFF